MEILKTPELFWECLHVLGFLGDGVFGERRVEDCLLSSFDDLPVDAGEHTTSLLSSYSHSAFNLTIFRCLVSRCLSDR